MFTHSVRAASIHLRWKKVYIDFVGLCMLAAIPAGAALLQAPLRQEPSLANIGGRSWKITPPAGHMEETWPRRRAAKDPTPYVSFANGVIQGSPGCGRFMGNYQRVGNHLSIAARWVD